MFIRPAAVAHFFFFWGGGGDREGVGERGCCWGQDENKANSIILFFI